MQSPAAVEESPPSIEICSETLGSEAALATFQGSVQAIFDCKPVVPGDVAAFGCRAITWHLGNLMIGTFRASAMTFHRSQQLVAISGIDHVMIQLYVTGSFDGVAGTRPIRVQPGDICLFDMSSTLSTHTTDFRNLSIMVPRAYFEAALVNVSSVHGLVLSGQHAPVQVAADFLTALERRIPNLSTNDAQHAASAIVTLVASLLPREFASAASTADRRSSPFRAASRYIEMHRGDPDLTPEAVAQACHMSRATLYRLLEPLGGVSQYIRRSRLVAAAIELSSANQRNLRIVDIALRNGFQNESSFARAFRAQFGMSPREARRIAGRNWTAASILANDTGERFTAWLQTL